MAELIRCHDMGVQVRRIHRGIGAMTDTSRNKTTRQFMDEGSEWLWFVDDDTVPPAGTLYRLLELAVSGNHRIVSGVYYGRVDIKGGAPVSPMVYRYDPKNGLYYVIPYYKGTLLPADATGLGCCLIHRSVFNDYMDHHVLMQRPTGPWFPVPPEQVDANLALGATVVDLMNADPATPYPFFIMDSGRTEDMFFFEGTRRFGERPFVDTKLECDHLGEYAINGKNFWDKEAEA